MINLCLKSTRLLKKVNAKSNMSSNEKFGNTLGDIKEAVGNTLLAENRSVTKDAEKVLTNWKIRYCLRRNPQQRVLRKVLTNR